MNPEREEDLVSELLDSTPKQRYRRMWRFWYQVARKRATLHGINPFIEQMRVMFHAVEENISTKWTAMHTKSLINGFPNYRAICSS